MAVDETTDKQHSLEDRASATSSQSVADLDLLLPPESRGADLVIAQSDLCPAIVIRARSQQICLFAELDAWGLGGPTHVAIPTADGVETLALEESAATFNGERQTEPWLLCWFEGAPGWDRLWYGQPCHWRGRHVEKPFPHVDVPWLIVLQRRAERIELHKNGLDLAFSSEAGTIVAMPLYGVDFLSTETTRAWRDGLPDEVRNRCRCWSRRLRRVPIACREEFTADAERDVVAIAQTFDYLTIEDDWNTPAETIAPYPPFAVLAAKYGFPIALEEPPSDGEIATLYGPYAFRRGAQSAAYELRGLLRYIREDEIYSDAPHSSAAERAVAHLRRALDDDPYLAAKTSGGYTRGLALALVSYAQALRYLAAEQKPAILDVMHDLLERILDPSHYMPLIRYPTTWRRLSACANGRSSDQHTSSPDAEPVGEAICQGVRDAYKIVQANPAGVWAAAAQTGEWEQVRRAWPLIRRWFHLPFQTQWLTPLPARWEGLDVARALYDGTLGYARLAARIGELDDYREAAYLFTKVCAGWFATEMMPRYHREHRPWLFNTDADYLVWHPCRVNGYVLIANDHLLRSDEAEVDGRGWASAYGRLTPTSARFWRDHLRDRADEVLNHILPRCRPDWARAGAPMAMRSYVLDESAEQLEQCRDADEAAEKEAARDPLRLRTYHLFQSTPILKEIAIIEAGARPTTERVLPDIEPMSSPAEGASRTACRMEQTAMPVRVASGEETGSFPVLFWPGIRTPKKPFVVLDERLDVLPFGFIKWQGHPAHDSPAGRTLSQTHHPNWCLTLFIHHPNPSASQPPSGSLVAPLSEGQTNWALGCTAHVSKRFPFKEFKYADDRDAWLAAHRSIASQWSVLRPPHELTDGQGLRPGVEPWIRHAESDPAYVHWIAIDLGEVRPVDEVVIAHDPAWVSAGYRIEAAPGDVAWSAAMAGPDSRVWDDLLVEVAANREATPRHQFSRRRTRWVRISYTHPAPPGLAINRIVVWEIEVRGPLSAP